MYSQNFLIFLMSKDYLNHYTLHLDVVQRTIVPYIGMLGDGD